MRFLAPLALVAVANGCAATPPRATQPIELETADSYCTNLQSGEVCVSGVKRGLEAALEQALDGARTGGQLRLLAVAFDEAEVTLTYELALRDGTARRETLKRPYAARDALMREAVLRLLVDVVARVSGEVARANAPISM